MSQHDVELRGSHWMTGDSGIIQGTSIERSQSSVTWHTRKPGNKPLIPWETFGQPLPGPVAAGVNLLGCSQAVVANHPSSAPTPPMDLPYITHLPALVRGCDIIMVDIRSGVLPEPLATRLNPFRRFKPLLLRSNSLITTAYTQPAIVALSTVL